MSQLKRLVTTAPLLAYYDPAKKLTIRVCCLEHWCSTDARRQTSRIRKSSDLSDTEVGYAQIEKECLAIVFSLERFHQYTFGRETTVLTDHKPLETIVKNPLHRSESKACSFDCYSMTSKSPIDEARRCISLMLYLEHISPTAMTDKDSSHRSTPSSICLSANQHCRNYVLQLTLTAQCKYSKRRSSMAGRTARQT